MGEEFRSIIIPETVLIVENGGGQGYIVPKGNENILNTAKEWAKHFKYGEGETWKEKQENGYWEEGAIHEYQNGSFKLKLRDAAGYSCNSGKLSFWDCDVIAPDGKNFVIGINSYVLCSLLKSCTLIKGEVQENIYLGREKSNQGAYIEDSDDFRQAQKENSIRDKAKSKTTQYEIGDVVGTLTKKYVYCGTIYKHWDTSSNYLYEPGSWKTYIKLYAIKCPKPKKMHLYIEYNSNSKSLKNGSWSIEVKDRKASYINYGEKYNIDTSEAFELCKQWNGIGCYSLDDKNSLTIEELLEHYKKTTDYRVELY